MRLSVGGRSGQSVLEALREAGHALRAPCAGRGSCGKCRVVARGELTPVGDGESGHLSVADREHGVRLACLARFAADGTLDLELGDDGIAVPDEPLEAEFDAGVRSESARGRPLAAAVDIGTTTLVVALVDRAAGRVLSVATAANAQKSWGSDVVARIQAVIDNPGALDAQRGSVVRQVAQLVTQQLSAAGRTDDELGRLAVAGNTVMLHLFAGADPSGLAKVPFRPAFLEARTMAAADLSLPFSGCDVVLLPGMSAFVGADITAGVLATGLADAEGPELLLDIGTNGEMVLGGRGGLLATATAAGPAFEGAQITHGCPGVPGALDHAGQGSEGFWYTTIGNQPLTGICGSGLLDLAAYLRRSGSLDETGYLDLPEDAFQPEASSPVTLSQADLRQLQLAKGAIAAGVAVLCQRAGIPVEAVKRVHLAGGFGTLLNPASALAIGLLPQGLRGKVVPAGNTSLKGALAVLARGSALDEAARIARSVTSVDLAAEADFSMAFAEAMLFPEEPGDER